MSPAARSGSSLPHLARELMLKATVKTALSQCWTPGCNISLVT
jgi:hypothetical protein